MTGTKPTHVPYCGTASAMADLIAGQVQAIFDNVATSVEHVRAGKIRAIPATMPTRVAVLPEVPPVADTVPGDEAISFYGVDMPAGTPAEFVDNLNGSDPEIAAIFDGLGAIVATGSAADFGRLIDAEGAKRAAAVKTSGAALE